MTKHGMDTTTDFVGKKRTRGESTTSCTRPSKKNRQDDVIKAMGKDPCTERQILEAVGDNRYTREILRRLMTLQVVTRVGKGGSNDPFLYKVVKEICLDDMLLVDPALEIRLHRIENKIIELLKEQPTNVTEKHIRAIVGDNTGTGKALRRLVHAERVIREGRGGAGNPFTYRLGSNWTAPVPTPKKPKTKPISKAAKARPPPLDVKIAGQSNDERDEDLSFHSSPCSVREVSERLLSEMSTAACSTTDSIDEQEEDLSDVDSQSKGSTSGQLSACSGTPMTGPLTGLSTGTLRHFDPMVMTREDTECYELVSEDDDGEETLDMGDLTVVGKKFGIVVATAEEAQARNHPTPQSDALVASFLA